MSSTARQRKKAREYARKWRSQNPEKARSYVHKYGKSKKGITTRRKRERRARAQNPEKSRAKDRAYAKANPGFIRAKNIRTHYKVSLVQWLAMFHFQGQCCAICKTTHPGRRGWATDHDHETGRIRGLLCHRCNLRLGWLGDTRTLVQISMNRISAYLDYDLRTAT